MSVINLLKTASTETSLYSYSDFGDIYGVINDLAVSVDGSTISAAASSGGSPATSFIYISTDFGKTFTPKYTDNKLAWVKTAVSPNGRIVFAQARNESTWYAFSTDGGEIWNRISPPYTQQLPIIKDVAFSADSTKIIIAMAGYGKFYISNDAGATWSIITANYDQYGTSYFSVAASADFTKMFALVESQSYTFHSSDSGITWTRLYNNIFYGAGTFFGAESSADGNKLAFATSNGSVFTSIDAGISWEKAILPSGQISGITLSADASKLFITQKVGGTFGVSYLKGSTDFGKTWPFVIPSEENVPGKVYHWDKPVISADGLQLYCLAAIKGKWGQTIVKVSI